MRYSKPSSTNGSRLLLVCEVALGQCKDLLKRDTTLTSAPEGYHSVHGVRRTSKMPTDFEVLFLVDLLSHHELKMTILVYLFFYDCPHNL